jgi:hypothetical protein
MAWEGQWVSICRCVDYWVKKLTISLTSSPISSFETPRPVPTSISAFHPLLSSVFFSFGGCGRFRLVSANPSVFSRLLVVVVRLAAVADDEQWVSCVTLRYFAVIYLIFQHTNAAAFPPCW